MSTQDEIRQMVERLREAYDFRLKLNEKIVPMGAGEVQKLADLLSRLAQQEPINYTGRHQASFDSFLSTAPKAEPVAWRKDLDPPRGNYTLQWLSENPWPGQNHVSPLYAAPVPVAQQEPIGWLVDPCPLGPLGGGSRERRMFTDRMKAEYEAWHKGDRIIAVYAAPVPAPKE